MSCFGREVFRYLSTWAKLTGQWKAAIVVVLNLVECVVSFPWQHYWLLIPNCQWIGLQDERKGQTCVRGRDVEEGRRPCPSFYFPGGTTEKEIGKPSSCPTGNPVLVHLRPLFVTQLPIWLMQSLRQRLSELSSHQASREFSQDSYQFPCFLQLAPFRPHCIKS